MDEIQKDAFNLEMELEGKKATLQKLRSINSADSNTAPQNIVLHIDNIRDNSEFLPWEYQIRAIEANIIYIEEAILSNKKKYDRYNTLRSLSENLLKDTKNNASSFNTAQEFSSFVTDMMHSYRKTELNDFIPAYEQKEENAILKIYPLAETPKVSSIPRDIFKKSFIICAVLLMVTTLIAFLMESVKKTKI